MIDEDATLALRRYLLGLALVAVRIQEDYDLRIGCLLRTVGYKSKIVHSSSKPDEDFKYEKSVVFQYAIEASKKFVIGEDKKTDFDQKLAIAARKKAEKAEKEK